MINYVYFHYFDTPPNDKNPRFCIEPIYGQLGFWEKSDDNLTNRQDKPSRLKDLCEKQPLAIRLLKGSIFLFLTTSL